MKRNISSKLLVALCLLMTLASCKSKKKLVATPLAGSPATTETVSTPPPAKKVDLIAPVKAAQLAFSTFSGKATGKLDINGDKNDVTLNIRIAQGKKIWISVTVSLVVTVEVARAVITPDSLLMIDKVHGLYLRKPFSYLYKYTNSQINYQLLESMFVGNAQNIILNDRNANFQPDANGNIISGTLDDLVYKLLLNPDMRPAQLNISNHNAGQSLDVTNKDFAVIGGKKVPSQVDIQSSADKKNVHLTLHYTKIDWDQPLDYPFNIPEKYKPADEN
jgi:hypothetical protein